MSTLPADVRVLIKNCLGQNIENFDVTVHDGNKKGEGYIGEIIFATLKNKKNGKEDHLVIKKVFPSDKESTRDFLSSSYLNEIHFYTKIWPEMKKFQDNFPEATKLEIAPKCYGTSSETGEEKVILENLKNRNYQMHPKKTALGKNLYEHIFKLYGQFHALSFAMKHYQPETFSKLAKLLKNNWLGFADTELCRMGATQSFNGIKEMLEVTKQEDILKKLQPFIENGHQIFSNSLEYHGPHSVIIHGDCWSNNMMFKYSNSKQLEDIKLLDFQMCMAASPVNDLAYTFYSGASKDSLENWENLLKVYHNSLRKTLKEYNLDVDEIYTFDELKSEWKSIIKFSFVMGIMIWGAKFIEQEEVRDLDLTEKIDENISLRNRQDYIQSVLNLVKHVYDNEFL